MDYKVVYNLSDEQIIKYRARNYFGEWKTVRFLFNVHTAVNEEFINQNFDPKLIIRLFGPLYTDQTLVVKVESKNEVSKVNSINFSQVKVTYDLSLYTQGKKEMFETIYSYHKIINTYLIDKVLVETTNFEIRKNYCVVFQKSSYLDNQYIVVISVPELGLYAAENLPGLCASCQYFLKNNFLRCAVHPYSDRRTILICKDYVKI